MVEITAVVPTVNRPELLREALRSLQQQTLPPDEIIVMDDGSNPAVDPTALHAEFGPHVRVLRNEHSRGLAYGRNWGVEEAKGKYVVHLDDDDLLAPTTLEEAHRLLVSDPSLEIVFLGVEGFGALSEHFNRVQPEAVARACVRGKGNPIEDGIVLFGDGLMPAMLKAVPASFQHPMLSRETWSKICALRWQAYLAGTGAASIEDAKALITGQLRDSEWAIYAAAARKKTALLNLPRYLARCEGQSSSSRPENVERHLLQNLGIKTQLFRATSLPELADWKDLIRASLAGTQAGAAYHYFQKGQRKLAWRYACAAFATRPSLSGLRLALRVWLPRKMHSH